jgi:thiamine biosynthesis lipoprotein
MSSPGQAEFSAWGGRAVVWVTVEEALAAAVEAVERTIEEFDLACSSWRDDSELAAVNAGAGRPVAAGPILLDTVQRALHGAQLTGGALDPTVGQVLVNLGFTPAPAGEPGGEIRVGAVPGWQTVVVDPEAATIRLARGVRLDLGATAKALAADRAAASALAAAGDGGVLVSLSGDVSTAGTAPPGGWRIRVMDDHRADPDAPGQSISITGGGVATSSTTVRAHSDGERREHHLIDPATGAPAAVHFRTVSVAAATCEGANIASTAAIIRGAAAIELLEQLQLPSRLVRADGVVHHLAGWPSGAEDLPIVAPGTAEAA